MFKRYNFFAPKMNSNILTLPKSPKFIPIKKINLPNIYSEVLDNEVPIYWLPACSEPVVMIKVFFKAGRIVEPQKLVARHTISMLTEGSKLYTSSQIADLVEYYGASIKANIYDDNSALTLFCLNKHLPNLMPLFLDLINQPVFPEKELNRLIINSIEALKVDLQSTTYLADVAYPQALFGTKHPYGYAVTEQHYKAINTQILQSFFEQHYHQQNAQILVAGNITKEVKNTVYQYFNSQTAFINVKTKKESAPKFKPFTYQATQKNIPQKNATQTSIRVCMPLFNKTHPDYNAFQVLNTIIGGHFGSRLNANIRENKGYTYGIFSFTESLQHGGYWCISTEAGKEVKDKVLHEIFFEIERLRQKPVSKNELKLVQNYLLGSILNQVNGLWGTLQAWEQLLSYQQNQQHFYQKIETIKAITPQQIQDLAQQYLNPQAMSTICVG